MAFQKILAGVLIGLLFLVEPLQAAVEKEPVGQTVEGQAAGVDKRQAAIDEARSMMNKPLGSVPGVESVQRAPDEPASPVRARTWVTAGLFILFLAAAFIYFRKLALSAPDLPVAGDFGDVKNVRAILDKQDGFAEAKGINIKNQRFLELVVQKELITEPERLSLTSRFQGNDFAVLLYMVEQRPELKHTFGKLWGDSLKVAYTDPTKTIIQHELVNKLPGDFARRNNLIPLYSVEEVITLAMADAGNASLQRQVEGQLGAMVSPVFALPCQIQAAIEIARVSLKVLKDQLSEKLAGAAQEGAKIGKLAEEKSIAEFVRGLFLLAVKQNASDIHIEPHEDSVLIRLRIDGALQEYLRLPMRLFPSLSNVIKIMAGSDIGERRRPQDGRITLKLPDRDLEFRFSCVPTIYGEKIVLRLLGQNQFVAAPGLDELQFSKPILDGIRKIIAVPNGVFFVTGPTGSGKTTTLYAVLKELNRKDRNIMTIEDPVEYRLAGINQVQVNPPAGVTFASALRSFLRQDPDVILVGEIRDLETATIASQAALTGHLVLTTLHTNNALQAVTRLIQIGVEPFLVAPSIIGVMAQRLVRRLCDNCKEKYALSPEEIKKHFAWDEKTEVFFYRKKGCEKCNYTGYAGRIAIHELFIIDDEMRNYIARNASILDIQKYAYSAGFNTMRYDGFKKILMGLTTLEEINQFTVESI